MRRRGKEGDRKNKIKESKVNGASKLLIFVPFPYPYCS
jgi:hypothetical protein